MPRISEGGTSRAIRRAAIPEPFFTGTRGQRVSIPTVGGEPYIRQFNPLIAGNRPISPALDTRLNQIFPGGWGPVPNVAQRPGGLGNQAGAGGVGGGGDLGGGFQAQPWNVNLRFPESPFRQWFTQTPNVPWYNPLTSLTEGQVEGLDPATANQILVMNALLPFLGQEDVGSMARFLSMSTGGERGPFGGYLRAGPIPSPVRGQLGEQRRLEDALAVARLLSDPGMRSLSEGVLGLGLSGLGPTVPGEQDILARSRSNTMRFLSQLGGLTGQGGPGAGISPLLSVLARPTSLRARPGQLLETQGGYQVQPNPAWYTG